jgi:hypothetical protein
MKVTLKRVANIVSLVEKGNESNIIKTWYDDDFTSRKLNNTIQKLVKNAPAGEWIVLEI